MNNLFKIKLSVCYTIVIILLYSCSSYNNGNNSAKVLIDAKLQKMDLLKGYYINSLNSNLIDYLEISIFINDNKTISYILTSIAPKNNQCHFVRYNYLNGRVEKFNFPHINFEKLIQISNEKEEKNIDNINYVSLNGYIEININFKHLKKNILRKLNESQKQDRLSESIYNYLKEKLFYIELKKSLSNEIQVEHIE